MSEIRSVSDAGLEVRMHSVIPVKSDVDDLLRVGMDISHNPEAKGRRQ